MKRQLAILFTSSWYPSRVHPTLGNFVERHADAVALYAPVHVLYVTSDTISKPYEIEEKEEGNKRTITVYYKKVQSNIPIISKVLKFIRYKKASRIGLAQLKEKYAIKRFDICHHSIHFEAGIIPLSLKKKEGTPYIISENWTGYLPEGIHHYKGFWRKYITKKIGRNCDIECPVSYDLQEALEANGIGKRFSIVPNVVKVDDFELKVRQADFDKEIRFIHVSTLDEAQKNIKGILNAFGSVLRLYPQAKLTFVNDGDPTLAQAHAKQLGISDKIVFTGRQDGKGVAKHLSESDIFVLFSNYENLPCVVIEAMAVGLPIIASTAGGTHEHITKEYGELVEPKDEKGLADKMMYVIENYHQYNAKALSDYAKHHFSYEVVGQQFMDIYRSLQKD